MPTRAEKTFAAVTSGLHDSNISFSDLRHLLDSLDFSERIKGDHHIYSHAQILEIINIQPERNKAKAYQVRQIREILQKYRMEV